MWKSENNDCYFFIFSVKAEFFGNILYYLDKVHCSFNHVRAWMNGGGGVVLWIDLIDKLIEQLRGRATSFNVFNYSKLMPFGDLLWLSFWGDFSGKLFQIIHVGSRSFVTRSQFIHTIVFCLVAILGSKLAACSFGIFMGCFPQSTCQLPPLIKSSFLPSSVTNWLIQNRYRRWGKSTKLEKKRPTNCLTN